MKHVISPILIALFISFTSCSDVSPDAVELTLDYTWEGFLPCSPGTNPEIRVSGIPDDTKFLLISMSGPKIGMNYGKQKIAYVGSDIIKMGTLDEIDGPCDMPINAELLFEYTVEAINEDGVIIGSGSKQRSYPDNK